MTWLGTELIVSGLQQLASRELQESLWLSDRTPASFIEAVEQVFDDSALGDALEKGQTGYSKEIEDRFRELDLLLSKVKDDRSEDAIIADPAMAVIREKAATILRMIEASAKRE